MYNLVFTGNIFLCYIEISWHKLFSFNGIQSILNFNLKTKKFVEKGFFYQNIII